MFRKRFKEDKKKKTAFEKERIGIERVWILTIKCFGQCYREMKLWQQHQTVPLALNTI